MQIRCKSRYGCWLAFSLTLAFTHAFLGHANAQTRTQTQAAERSSAPVLLVEPPSVDALTSTSEVESQVLQTKLELPRPLTLASSNQQANPLASPAIGSRDIACQAAHAWMPAKQLRQQAKAVQELHCDSDECTQQAAKAIAGFLNQQAAHQQDVAAAIALRGLLRALGYRRANDPRSGVDGVPCNFSEIAKPQFCKRELRPQSI